MDYNQTLKLDPTHFNAYNNRGNIRRQSGDAEGSLQDYNKAIEINPTYAEAYLNRGLAFLELKNNTAGLADLDKAAELLEKQGRKEDAQQVRQVKDALEEHFKSDPEKPTVPQGAPDDSR